MTRAKRCVQENINLTKRARIDDRYLGNGSRTPKIGVKKSLHTDSVESAISDFSGADAQIGSANYRFIRSPVTGLADELSFMPRPREAPY